VFTQLTHKLQVIKLVLSVFFFSRVGRGRGISKVSNLSKRRGRRRGIRLPDLTRGECKTKKEHLSGRLKQK